MFDTIIRGGKIVDGSGAPIATGDVAVKDGRIVEVGGKISGAARETIDADGALVTPGFVDVHTHYDGQFLWDEKLDPSFSNGVTTVVGGNCGVGFAPVKPEHRQGLIELMEGVEEIPGIVLDEGLSWDWRSFPEYLDRIDERKHATDVAVQMSHAPLRVFVMGERALAHEDATADDLAEMSRLLQEGMAAGAAGFSTGLFLEHKSSRGEFVPGTFAKDEELITLAEALGQTGRGAFEVITAGGVGNIGGNGLTREARLRGHDRLVRLARAAGGRPLTYLLAQFHSDPDEWQAMLEESSKAFAEGVPIYPQIGARAQGILTTLDGYHLFQLRPSYLDIAHLPRAVRAARMRDPELRRKILDEVDIGTGDSQSVQARQLLESLPFSLPNYYVILDDGDYEPGPELRVGFLAERAGQTVPEFIYDFLAEGEGANLAANFYLNYTGGNLDPCYAMLDHPHTVTGLGDGGAHLKMVCDASMSTFHLTFWARDRKRGPKLPVEKMVKKLSSEAAALYGLADRGVLKPGKRADVNVIDFDNLKMETPRIHFDLPRGSGRFLQFSTGYVATLLNGKTTRRNDLDTGARPGRLVRAV